VRRRPRGRRCRRAGRVSSGARRPWFSLRGSVRCGRARGPAAEGDEAPARKPRGRPLVSLPAARRRGRPTPPPCGRGLPIPQPLQRQPSGSDEAPFASKRSVVAWRPRCRSTKRRRRGRVEATPAPSARSIASGHAEDVVLLGGESAGEWRARDTTPRAVAAKRGRARDRVDRWWPPAVDQAGVTRMAPSSCRDIRWPSSGRLGLRAANVVDAMLRCRCARRGGTGGVRRRRRRSAVLYLKGMKKPTVSNMGTDADRRRRQPALRRPHRIFPWREHSRRGGWDTVSQLRQRKVKWEDLVAPIALADRASYPRRGPAHLAEAAASRVAAGGGEDYLPDARCQAGRSLRQQGLRRHPARSKAGADVLSR
jgi:hypothetical protein